jgi:hypothetical protein
MTFWVFDWSWSCLLVHSSILFGDTPILHFIEARPVIHLSHRTESIVAEVRPDIALLLADDVQAEQVVGVVFRAACCFCCPSWLRHLPSQKAYLTCSLSCRYCLHTNYQKTIYFKGAYCQRRKQFVAFTMIDLCLLSAR